MSRTPIPAEAFDHGDPRRYRRGCRCKPCIKGVTAEVRQGRFLRATGRGRMTTPERAARHIARLRNAGMPDSAIMHDSLISQDALYRIVRQASDILRSTETRILAVQPRPSEGPGSGTHVPGIGAIRRLRALAADGWPAAELGRRCGKHKQFIVYLQKQDSDTTVRHWVADYVSGLYLQLDGLKPEDNGVPAHIAKMTRDRAAGKGWTGTAYWDPEDFDDPDFKPATEVVGLAAEIVAENATWLIEDGLHRDLAAKRLGKSRFYIDRAIREAEQVAA